MCGLIGRVAGTEGGLPAPDRRAALMDALAHRGPDARGEVIEDGVWLGHLRLKILDLSECGAQPMRSADGRYVMAYNGETYNYRELRRELGLEVRSTGDTEVVLEAFRLRGTDVLPRLNGMFAFAVYDTARRKAWLVRDRLGIKPLYYHVGPDGLSFASELGALLDLVPDARSCETSHLHEWVYYGTTLGGGTLFRGVQQLPPGHVLEVDTDTLGLRTRSYWSPADFAGGPKLTLAPGERASRTLELLDAAVQRQLVSDVPLAVTLSGGIDSSAITALAARHRGSITTYSVGFDFEGGVDELADAAFTARHFGTEHHEIHIAGVATAEVVTAMIDHHAHPFSDAANVPLYLIAREIGSSARVLLQGDGGDELFGGYPRYRSLAHPILTGWLARAGSLVGRHVAPSRLGRRLARYDQAMNAGDAARRMALLMTEETVADEPHSVFGPAVIDEVLRADPFARYEECQALVRAEDPVNQMLLVDAMIVLPDIFLEKVDRATMAASVEVRVPFLDHELVDFCMRLSGPAKVPGGRQKWLLRKALEGVLPDEVLRRPKKGFGVPYGFWLRDGLRDFFLDTLGTFANHYPDVLDHGRILRYHEEHVARTVDRSFLLWKVLNFALWGTRFRVSF